MAGAYGEAISQSWGLLRALGKTGETRVEFLGLAYQVDFNRREIRDASLGSIPREWRQILILHYLAREKPVEPPCRIEWVSFQELDSGPFFHPSYAKRSLDLLARRFPGEAVTIWENARGLSRAKLGIGDFGFSIRVFPKVFVAVLFWRGDGEVAARFDLLFNREISRIFATEDVVVLAQGTVEVLLHPMSR